MYRWASNTAFCNHLSTAVGIPKSWVLPFPLGIVTLKIAFGT
jgi:hypothetical protein